MCWTCAYTTEGKIELLSWREQEILSEKNNQNFLDWCWVIYTDITSVDCFFSIFYFLQDSNSIFPSVIYAQVQHTCVCYQMTYVDLWYNYVHFSYYFESLTSPPLDIIWVMVIVWRLRANIIRTALCLIVWHNVHSQQHTYMSSSSYRSNRFGLSHWDPYAICRCGCLELCYCNIVEWFWWDSSLILTTGNWFNRPRNDL